MSPEGQDGEGSFLEEARRLIDVGKWAEAMWALDAFLGSVGPDDTSNKKDLAEAHRMRGLVLSRMSRFKDAVHDYMRSIELCHSLGDRTGEAMSLDGLAYVHWNMGDTNMAMEFYEKALAMAKEAGDKKLEATVLIGMANVHNVAGELEEAVIKYQGAIDMLAAMGPSVQLARAYNNIGDALIKLGRIDEAIECLEGAVDVGEEIGNLAARGIGRTFLAICHARKGDMNGAMGLIDKAIGDLGAAHDKIGFIQAISTLGMLHSKAGRHDLALQEIAKAEEMAKKAELEGLRGEVLLEKARVLVAKGDVDFANVAYKQAIGIMRALGNKSGISDAESEMARAASRGAK